MIPLRDVVATGQRPLGTLALMLFHFVLFVGIDALGGGPWLTRLGAAGPGHLVIGLAGLWLFGDHVEARLGRARLLAVYGGGLIAAAICDWLLTAHAAGLWSSAAVAAIVAAHFVLLPQSRMLMLVPLPPFVIETPSVLIAAAWAALQFLALVALPASGASRGDTAALVAMLTAALTGAGLAAALRQPVRWPSSFTTSP